MNSIRFLFHSLSGKTKKGQPGFVRVNGLTVRLLRLKSLDAFLFLYAEATFSITTIFDVMLLALASASSFMSIE